MKLLLKRNVFTENSTIGELYIGGALLCYTLEDVIRDEKIYAQTAIPEGTYKVVINMSKRFKVLMPLLIDVPNFEGVRIHWGNKALDSSGCLLVGMSKTIDYIGSSRIAYNKLMAKITGQKNITIEIK